MALDNCYGHDVENTPCIGVFWVSQFVEASKSVVDPLYLVVHLIKILGFNHE